MVPDTQIDPDVPTQHLDWISRYVLDKYEGRPNVKLIQIGDWWNMGSLSSYDRGKGKMEGRRFLKDVQAGNEAWTRFTAPFAAARENGWPIELIYTYGNHEERILRAANDNAQLDGLVSLDALQVEIDKDDPLWGWKSYPFLQPVNVDGVYYSHYFYNPNTGRPYSGANIETRLKTLGHSFTMGHQQTLGYALRPVAGRMQHGLVAGAAYIHDEDYLGPQGNAYWRGIIIKHQVEDGSYDPMFLSLDYLCRRYEGVRLKDFRL